VHRAHRSRNLAAFLALALVALVALGCPDDPLGQAKALEDRGETEASAAAYLAAAKADPALIAAWDGAIHGYCRVLSDVGRCLSVLDYELELLGPVPRHADALAEALEARGRARLAKGMVDAAQSDFERAEQVAPERGSVQAALARVALARGDQALAAQRLDDARKLDPGLPELEELWPLTQTASSAPDAPAIVPSEPAAPAFGR